MGVTAAQPHNCDAHTPQETSGWGAFCSGLPVAVWQGVACLLLEGAGQLWMSSGLGDAVAASTLSTSLIYLRRLLAAAAGKRWRGGRQRYRAFHGPILCEGPS